MVALEPHELKEIREIKKKYDYDGFADFDFAAAPDPPQSFRNTFQWDHPGWNKSLGNTVVTREVRDEWWECKGGVPNLRAPGLLDERDFRKFCYYAPDYLLDDFPKKYLPHVYRDSPEEWEDYKRQQKENRKRWKGSRMDKDIRQVLRLPSDSEDEDSSSEEEEDETKADPSSGDDRKPPASASSKIIWVQRADKKEDTTKDEPDCTTPLLDLDARTRARVAEYLDPLDWWSLRKTCQKAVNTWPKPKPEVEYDFVYFSLSNAFDCVWHGVAHTLDDVRAALLSLQDDAPKYTDFWQQDQLHLTAELFRFDRAANHPIVPLLRFEDWQYYELDDFPATLHELGCRYFGVESVLACPLGRGSSFSFWGPEDEDSEPRCEDGFGNYLQWCKGLEPRTPRMNLEHIGIRKLGCTSCGQSHGCTCSMFRRNADYVGPGGSEGNDSIIYYSPRWFGDGKSSLLCHGSTDANNPEQKTWIIFDDTTSLWDRY